MHNVGARLRNASRQVWLRHLWRRLRPDGIGEDVRPGMRNWLLGFRRHSMPPVGMGCSVGMPRGRGLFRYRPARRTSATAQRDRKNRTATKKNPMRAAEGSGSSPRDPA
jgi:hypothetical protein